MQNICEGEKYKIEILNFVIRTLQNEDFLHFFTKIFAQFKKKLYLYSENKNQRLLNILAIRYISQMLTACKGSKNL